MKKEQVKNLPRGRQQKKKDELLETTLKYFEDQTNRHCRDHDIDRLQNSEHSNRQVICDSSRQDLEDFLKLGNVKTQSKTEGLKSAIEND